MIERRVENIYIKKVYALINILRLLKKRCLHLYRLFSTYFERTLDICICQCFCLKNQADFAELQAVGQNGRCLTLNERCYAVSLKYLRGQLINRD